MDILLMQTVFFEDITFIYPHIIKIQKEKCQSFHQNHSQGLKIEELFVAEMLYKFGGKKIFIMSVKCLKHQRKIAGFICL